MGGEPNRKGSMVLSAMLASSRTKEFGGGLRWGDSRRTTTVGSRERPESDRRKRCRIVAKGVHVATKIKSDTNVYVFEILSPTLGW